MEVVFPLKGAVLGSKAIPRQTAKVERRSKEAAVATERFSREAWETALSVTALAGDFAMIFSGFILAFWMWFHSGLIPLDTEGVPIPPVASFYKQIFLGSTIVFWGLLRKDLYKHRSLLFPQKSMKKLAGCLTVCLIVFVIISLAIRTDPLLSKAFVACALFVVFMALCLWRLLFSQLAWHPALAARLRKRLVVIGGGSQARRIQKALEENSDMQFVGWVQAIQPNRIAELKEYRLGSLHELRSILNKHAVDIAVLTESESLQREGVQSVARVCENEYVQFKMVPHFFEILISGLCPDVIGDFHVLGVDCLPLTGRRNRSIKRAIDIAGAVVGLILSAPLVLICGALVYLESPGPIFYKQVRLGKNGRLFKMIKIRSMRPNAEAAGKAKWAQENDPRRLRIGAFLRKWNIDEVPQFWNVLRGQMSLVGPRPERPELIERFKTKIPHYQARHSCHPGLTGWAQVNGWRGNTDLEERIRHDIWYVEHWNLWLDFRIMFLTFFRRENAY